MNTLKSFVLYLITKNDIEIKNTKNVKYYTVCSELKTYIIERRLKDFANKNFVIETIEKREYGWLCFYDGPFLIAKIIKVDNITKCCFIFYKNQHILSYL